MMSALSTVLVSVLLLTPVSGLLLTLRVPQLRPLPVPSRAHVRAAAADNLTVGDALIGSLTRQISQLPEYEHLDRADRTLDAVLDASKSELEQIKWDLLRDLRATELNTTRALREQLTITQSIYVKTFNETVVAIDEVLAPSRKAVRTDLDRLLAEQMARRAAKRRGADSIGVGRSRREAREALERFSAKPVHPIVRLCEASALTMSLLLMLAAGDLVSSQHHITSPPQIAHVSLDLSPLTAENDPTDAPEYMPAPEAWAEVVAAAKAPKAPATGTPEGAPTLAEPWWRAMRWALLVYLSSFAGIIARAGCGDEWAVLALGMTPSDGKGGKDLIRWVYDWDRDMWRKG